MSELLHAHAAQSLKFMQLPDDEKSRVRQLCAVMGRVLSASRPRAQIAAEAAALGGWGTSAKTLERYYYALKKDADWTIFVRKNANPDDVGLSDAERKLWHSFCHRNQRGKLRAAHRRLLEALRAGDVLDGVGTWLDLWKRDFPEKTPPSKCPATFIPRGWTYGNLCNQRNRPTKFEMKAVTIGRAAAADLRPLVYTTRAGMKVGQQIMFDDLWHDLKVTHVANKLPKRPLELAAVDVLSGCKFTWGFKPVLENEDDDTVQTIREKHMRFFLAHVLTEFGYRPDGTTFLTEHRTAAIPEDVEKFLHDVSDGAIRVERSGIEKAAAFAGHFPGRGRGNPRFKAALESSHNLAHNETAHLPGQMGMNRDRSPEELYGREQYFKSLVKVMEMLPAAVVQQLRLPFLEYNRAIQVITEINHRINLRDWHALEGWIEAGFVTEQFRIGPGYEWINEEDLLALPPEKFEALRAVFSQPDNHRTRKLSPHEVFTRGRGDLVKLPGHCVPVILGPDNAIPLRVDDDHLFRFEDQDIGPGMFMYEADLHTPRGRVEELRPGECFMVHVNPFDLRWIYVSKAGVKSGAFLGMCKRWDRVDRTDMNAVHVQMGKSAAKEKLLLAPLAAAGAAVTQQKAEDKAWNDQLIALHSAPTPKLGKAAEDINVVQEILKSSPRKSPTDRHEAGESP